MKTTTVNVHDAKTQLSKLIARAEKGERITIARAGKAVAELGPVPRRKRGPRAAIDPLLEVDEYSYTGAVAQLSNRDMDTLIYGG